MHSACCLCSRVFRVLFRRLVKIVSTTYQLPVVGDESLFSTEVETHVAGSGKSVGLTVQMTKKCAVLITTVSQMTQFTVAR